MVRRAGDRPVFIVHLKRRKSTMLARLLLASLAVVVPFAPAVAGPPARQEQVKIEVRIITVAEDFFERIGVDFSDPNAKGKVIDSSAEKEPIFLNDKKLSKFLESVEADVRTNIVQTPSVIVSNGKTAVMRCLHEEPLGSAQKGSVATGYEISLQPQIAADGRAIALDLKTSLCSRDSEKSARLTTLSLEDQLSIPAGHTAVLGGWKRLSEGRIEYGGPPAIGKVPYLNRLFKNVGYTRATENVLVLVTASIVGDETKKAAATRSNARQQTAQIAPQSDHNFIEQYYQRAYDTCPGAK
jgi:type II secretory pathway component GspD/PulD (secretin)